MTARPFANHRLPWRFAGVLILASLWPAGTAWGQGGLPAELPLPQSVGGPDGAPPPAAAAAPVVDPNVVPAGCSTCGSGLLGAMAPPAPDAVPSGGCSSCGGDGCAGGCYPGRKQGYCCCCNANTCCGRLLCGVYDCICCPDPCYEPRWIAVQDSAFFVDSARPITQLRIRGDGGFDIPTPDRAEYFWARERTTPNQLEPGPTDPKAPGYNCFRHGFGKGPAFIARDIDREDLSLYTEGAIDRFSFFVELPYREVDVDTAGNSFMLQTQPLPPGMPANVTDGLSPLNNRPLAPNTPLPTDIKVGAAGATVTPVPGTLGSTPTDNRSFAPGTVLTKGTKFPGTLTLGGDSRILKPAQPPVKPVFVPGCNASGFADMNLGTKAVLLDCELLLLTFQFKTFLPTGNFIQGLGTGHVSLEPALLFALKLTPEMYLQGEFAYWIPIGGDALYEGDIFHEHFSLNRTLWCPCPGLRLVGTLEASHYQILGGNFTSPDLLLPDTRPGHAKGALAPVALSATTGMLSVGPGVRFFICDKIDIGVGTQFAITEDHFEEELIRAEFRWRF